MEEQKTRTHEEWQAMLDRAEQAYVDLATAGDKYQVEYWAGRAARSGNASGHDAQQHQAMVAKEERASAAARAKFRELVNNPSRALTEGA